jgi:HK97 family phage portal protein
VNPSGSIELAQKLAPDVFQNLAEKFRKAFAGPTKAACVLVLDQGMQFKKISIDPESAQFLESRRFSVEEIARLYGVPPPVAGDLSHGSFANVEHLIRWFAIATLTPWARKIEAEFSKSVFSASTRGSRSLELDLSGLLRGAPTERWQAWEIAARNNILDVNEIREAEGWGPRAQPVPVTN